MASLHRTHFLDLPGPPGLTSHGASAVELAANADGECASIQKAPVTLIFVATGSSASTVEADVHVANYGSTLSQIGAGCM